MADTPAPRNRRERRAEAKQTGKPFVPMKTTTDIPMAVPDFSRPTGKTLLDVAEERSQALIDKADALNRQRRGDEDGDNGPIGALGEAIFLSITLFLLHVTLNVLVHNQYGPEKPSLGPLVKDSLRVAPALLIAVYALKRREIARRPTVKQVLHFVLGTAAGAYMLWLANRESYIGIMKRAPSVGAVWIWNVIEMRLEWAVSSLAVCGVWLWWHGFSLY